MATWDSQAKRRCQIKNLLDQAEQSMFAVRAEIEMTSPPKLTKSAYLLIKSLGEYIEVAAKPKLLIRNEDETVEVGEKE